MLLERACVKEIVPTHTHTHTLAGTFPYQSWHKHYAFQHMYIQLPLTCHRSPWHWYGNLLPRAAVIVRISGCARCCTIRGRCRSRSMYIEVIIENERIVLIALCHRYTCWLNFSHTIMLYRIANQMTYIVLKCICKYTYSGHSLAIFRWCWPCLCRQE